MKTRALLLLSSSTANITINKWLPVIRETAPSAAAAAGADARGRAVASANLDDDRATDCNSFNCSAPGQCGRPRIGPVGQVQFGGGQTAAVVSVQCQHSARRPAAGAARPAAQSELATSTRAAVGPSSSATATGGRAQPVPIGTIGRRNTAPEHERPGRGARLQPASLQPDSHVAHHLGRPDRPPRAGLLDEQLHQTNNKSI